jgi:O-antigen ligase
MAASRAERLVFNYGHRPGETVPGRPQGRSASPRYTEIATWRTWRAVDRGYLGLLAFVTVLMVRPQDYVPGLASIHFAELAAVLGIAPMIVDRLSRGVPLVKLTPESIAMFTFGAIILASAPFSIWPGGTVAVFTDIYVKILIVFVLMMNTITTPKRLQQIAWVILICCGLVGGRAAFDYVRGVNLVEGGRAMGPIGGAFSNPNDLATNLVSFIPAGIVVALSPRHPTWRRLIAALMVAFMAAAIVSTQSRGGFLGLAVALLTLVALGRHVRRGFGALALIGVLVALPLMPSSFWQRMNSIVDAEADQTEFTGSREARRIVMEEGISTFAAHPLTGVGAGQFKNYDPAGRRERWRETHNAIIQVAAETGILGLLMIVFLIWRGMRAGGVTRAMLARMRRMPDRPDALTTTDRTLLYEQSVAASAGLAGWFVCALFASIAYNWTFYLLFAVAIAGRDLTRARLREATAWKRA